jgi:predicted XRE-type DNA-binding protein
MSSTASKKTQRKRAAMTSKRPRQGTARSASASAKAAQSLFEDLGFSPTESRREAVKAELYVAILKIVRERGLTARQLGEILGKPHSRVSELLNGKLNLVKADTLIGYLDQLGVDVSIKVTRRAS